MLPVPRSGSYDWARAGVATTVSTAMMLRSLFMSLLLCSRLEAWASISFVEWVLGDTGKIGFRFAGTIKLRFRKLNSILTNRGRARRPDRNRCGDCSPGFLREARNLDHGFHDPLARGCGTVLDHLRTRRTVMRARARC